MGAKIDSFLNSFNDALLKVIDGNSEKKTNFDRVRADAIKISINRLGSFPNKSSVVTIGDLFGYVFPAEGGIKNEPTDPTNPEYLTYLEDINNFKKIYADLKNYYRFSERSSSLKEKGGAQLWFDYFMYFSYVLFLKNDSFLKKIKEANENSSSEYYQLMPNGGSSVNYYNTFDLFDNAIFNDSNINDSNGVNRFLTSNLATDELLYDAFIEAGDSYEGPYTKDIKDPVNFFNLLDGNVPKIEPEVSATSASTPEVTPVGSTPSAKIPLIVYDIPDDFTIQAKTDMPLFSIYVGDQSKKVFDDYNDLSELDSEYGEDVFKGEEESAVTLEQYNLEIDISNGQEDSDSNLGKVGDPVEIKPVSSFDGLLELAGKCARELGKNSKVKYENLKKGYTKGIHGLCPQGTQAVLYAMSGIKSLGQISGNADYFSFKYNKSSFSKTGYYNDKVKIDISYTNDKSRWQVGDVVAMGYLNGKPYGHIQVWTGNSWMSDFKQGNSIQKVNVDWKTAALWRLNKKGVDAVNKQLKSVS